MAQTKPIVGDVRRRRPVGDAFDRTHAAMLLVVLAALLPGLVGPSREAPGLRQDEVQCEEAMAHLDECCSPFEGKIDCHYRPPSACENDADYPDLRSGDSKDIRALSCSEIVAGDYCRLEPDDRYDPL